MEYPPDLRPPPRVPTETPIRDEISRTDLTVMLAGHSVVAGRTGDHADLLGAVAPARQEADR